MSTDEVLSSLDRALHDWDTSPDAMRSKPADDDLVIEPTFHPAYVIPAQRQPEHDHDCSLHFCWREGHDPNCPDQGADGCQMLPVEPYVASRRQVVPLLDELAHRVLTWLLRRNR